MISISPYKRQEGALCVLEANYIELQERLTQALSTVHFQHTQNKLVLYPPATPTPRPTSTPIAAAAAAATATATATKQTPVTGENNTLMPSPSQLPLVKSPNCVCCGTSTVLSGLYSIFGPMTNVSVTTFQSLSGRGDSKYPSELVVGNVYPLRSTTEPTEELICEELAHVLGNKLTNGRKSLSVGAYRVSVQRGHLVDVRIRFENRQLFDQLETLGGALEMNDAENKKKMMEIVERKKMKFIEEEVYDRLDSWCPLLDALNGDVELMNEHLPSVPTYPIQSSRDQGEPRPKSHHLHSIRKTDSTSERRRKIDGVNGNGNGNGNGLPGYQVTVGNVGVNDGPYDLVLTLVVDNLVKGALGAALQLLEYTLMVTKARDGLPLHLNNL